MNWKDVKREMMRNPRVLREYAALEPEYQLARSIMSQRIAKGWSQRELAERVGTKQPVISRLETGSAKPSVTLLERVARALDAELVVRIDPRVAGRRPARLAPTRSPRRRMQNRATATRR